MIRDLNKIDRDLENNQNNDIIYKKSVLSKVFNEDPDLKEILGVRSKRPLNKFQDPSIPTEQELKLRKEIEEYNRRVETPQIIPFLKLNGVQKEVNNFIMFDVHDYDTSYYNKAMKVQQIVVFCMVHEDDVYTEYNITRQDLLSYIVKDLLCWSNVTGFQLKCVSDYSDIIDDKYYTRILKFNVNTPNFVPTHMGMTNKYDKLP